MKILTNVPPDLLSAIRNIINQAQAHLQSTVNRTMVQTYWNVGRLIVEHEQGGKSRAAYGQKQLKELAKHLKSEFGKGFDERNLRNMRAFYLTYPKWNAVRSELSWTHYRILTRINDEDTRNWYMNECVEQNLSARALERQISTLYYERLLSSKDKKPVIEEAQLYTKELQNNPKDYLRDPYVLDFMNLPYDSLLESNIEQALMDVQLNFLIKTDKGHLIIKISLMLFIVNY